MRLHSTRDHTSQVTAAQSFLQGISPEGGLFVPDDYPAFSLEEIASMAALPYEERVVRVLEPYLTDYTREELTACVNLAYGNGFGGNPAPLVKLPDCHMLELWHGPTSAFKDMALQLLPHLMGLALKKEKIDKEIMILVATSGDTGKAALAGFADVPGTRVLVFYPDGGVSEAQRLQMATQEGSNVYVASVRGNFDDTQTGVKTLFTSPDFIERQASRGRILSSANSINFGRLVPQVAYYFSAYADMIATGAIKAGDKINFTVPTGNFGNILAGWYAMHMGLPINRLICASNSNNVLADFIQSGAYSMDREFHITSSPSMDILISSNLERLLYDLCERDDKLIRRWMSSLRQTGGYDIGSERADAMRKVFSSGWADNSCVSYTIEKVWSEEHYLLDTHTAVARAVYDEYRRTTGDVTPTVIISTASPYKFPRDVLSAIEGDTPENEFFCADRLEQLTGMPMPEPLRKLRDLPILHGTVCDIDRMGEIVDLLVDGVGQE
jgi:threonine synthase